MKLFLQVGLTGWRKNDFGNLFLNYAASLSSDMLGTDLDSQSEPMIADLVLRLINQSQEVFLFVLSNDPALPLGSAEKVFSDLQTAESKVSQVVLCGDHWSAESILASFRQKFSKESNPDRIKELILQFSQ